MVVHHHHEIDYYYYFFYFLLLIFLIYHEHLHIYYNYNNNMDVLIISMNKINVNYIDLLMIVYMFYYAHILYIVSVLDNIHNAKHFLLQFDYHKIQNLVLFLINMLHHDQNILQYHEYI